MIGCFCLVSCICVSLKPGFISIIALWGVKTMPEQKTSEQIMFRSYGLFWRADRVFWGAGKGSAKGQLLGQEVGSKDKDPVDFRDQIGIYALHDNFELVYIGQVGAKQEKDKKGATLLTRLRAHRVDRLSERWDRFSWFGLRDVVKSSDKELTDLRKANLSVTRVQILNLVEAVGIALSEPRLNRQGGNLSKSTEYFQWHASEPDE